MGLIADLLAAGKGIDVNPPTTALDKIIIRELKEVVAQGDVALPTIFQARNEVQSLAQYTVNHTGGTFALTFTVSTGETWTTAAIAYNANAATIELAIDSAAPGFWLNGRIVVSGGTLLSAPVVLTYSEIHGDFPIPGVNHPLVVFDGALLTGGTSATPTESTTTEGQTDRPCWAATVALGLALESEVPVQGVTPGVLTGGDPSNPSYPSEPTIRALADEVAVEDGIIASRDAVLVAARLTILV